MLNRKAVLPALCLFLVFLLPAQTKTSLATGNWSNPGSWVPAGVPGPSDDVIISSGHAITLDMNGSCNTLTVGTGSGAAALLLSGNTPLTLDIGEQLYIASASSFSILSSSNTTHSLILGGDIINNGSLRLYQDANSLCDVLFNRNGDQTVSGSGALTRFNAITLNMGSSSSNVLEITTPSFSVGTNFLALQNGTFKFSSPGIVSIEPFRNLTTIPSSAGLWINSPNVTANTNAGIVLAGLLEISAGKLSVGNGINEDITAAGGTLSISGGTLIVAGKYNSASAAGTFNMSSGAIILAGSGSNNTSIAPFHISATGSYFSLSGGTIILEREGGSGTQDLGFVCTSAATSNLTGGMLQVGSPDSPANQTLSILCSPVLPNLTVYSPNVTAKIAGTDLNVQGNVTISSGTLAADNFNMSLGGNWDNSGSFSAGSGSVHFNSAAGQFVKKNGTEVFHHLVFSGAGIKTFSSAVTANGSFSIAAGTPVDLSTAGHSLSVKGHFTNNGSFAGGKGLVLLNGSSSQILSGAGTSAFYDLSIENPSGASFTSPVSIEGTLSLLNGTLSLNASTLTLVSNSLTTGRIAAIAGNADIQGAVTIQRYVAGGATGWTLLGTPVSSPLTLNDWDDDISISCPTCPDGTALNFLSIYTYDETAAGSYDAAGSYLPLNTINDAIIPGKGYWVYLGTGQFTTTGITLDVTGAVRKSDYTIPLSFSNYGSPLNDGWNLIHNPYPSPISWTSLKGSTSNLDNAIYAYNPDLNSGTGGYASCVNGISSPAVNAGGIGDNIAMCQGFYVHSTGATSLHAKESNKTPGNTGFLKEAKEPDVPLLRIALQKDTNLCDETVVYFEEQGTENFDSGYDAYKIRASDPDAPMIAGICDTVEFQINAVGALPGRYRLPLKTETGKSGSYSIRATELHHIPPGACVVLYDTWNKTNTDLRASAYTFYLSDTISQPRFELQVTFTKLEIDSSVVQPGCRSAEKGFISAKGKSTGPWDYTWKQDAVIIRQAFNKAGADTLAGLSAGSYELYVHTHGGCDQSLSQYVLLPQSPVQALFASPDSVFLHQGGATQYSNTSQGNVSNHWSFEVRPFFSDSLSPIATYTAGGSYPAKLVCTSSSGCRDSCSKTIIVIDPLTTGPAPAKQILLKTLGENRFLLEGNFGVQKQIAVMLHDTEGKLLLSFPRETAERISYLVDTNSYPPGAYFLRLFADESIQTFKILSR